MDPDVMRNASLMLLLTGPLEYPHHDGDVISPATQVFRKFGRRFGTDKGYVTEIVGRSMSVEIVQ